MKEELVLGQLGSKTDRLQLQCWLSAFVKMKMFEKQPYEFSRTQDDVSESLGFEFNYIR